MSQDDTVAVRDTVEIRWHGKERRYTGQTGEVIATFSTPRGLGKLYVLTPDPINRKPGYKMLLLLEEKQVKKVDNVRKDS